MSPFEIARACHVINQAICVAIGDKTQPSWDDVSIEMRESTVRGVIAVLENPQVSPEEQHESWRKARTEAGWVFGEALDREKKIHPDLKPYAELPVEHRVKSAVFIGTVNALRDR